MVLTSEVLWSGRDVEDGRSLKLKRGIDEVEPI